MTPLLKTVMMPYGVAFAIESRAGRQIMALLQTVDMAAHIRESRSRGYDDGIDTPGYEMNGSVAMLSLSGPLTKQSTSMQAMLGGTGTADFIVALTAAIADPAAKSIVAVIDSPGGSVDGTDELYQSLRDANAKKPVYAYCPDLCASAAYWAACGCSAIYVGATAVIGSIGIYTTVEDMSKAAEAAGVEVTVIGSAEMKGAGVAGTPITDTQKAEILRYVNDTNTHFVAAVAKGRKIPIDDARALADGRVHIGAKAQALGLTDGTMRLSELLAKIQSDPKAALPARTMHPNARPGNNNASGRQEKSMSKALLAGALAALGLHKMSGKALAAPEDDPQALAQVVASEMDAEVAGRVTEREASHPLLTALAAADIKTPEALTVLLREAATGREAVTSLRTKAAENAIIAYGTEDGAAEAETLNALSGPALTRYAARIEKDAQAKAGDGKTKTLATQAAGVTHATVPGDTTPETQAATADAALSQTALGRRALKLRASNKAASHG